MIKTVKMQNSNSRAVKKKAYEAFKMEKKIQKIIVASMIIARKSFSILDLIINTETNKVCLKGFHHSSAEK